MYGTNCHLNHSCTVAIGLQNFCADVTSGRSSLHALVPETRNVCSAIYTYFIPRFGGYATTDTHNLVFPTNFDCHPYKCYALLCYIVMTHTNVDLLICYLGHFKNKHLHDYHNDILLAIKTSTKRNPPTEAQQTQLHGFLPSTYWPY